MKILHIEDSPEISELFSSILEKENHQYRATVDAKKGLELVLNNQYDFIILDLCIPNYSGMDFLVDLKVKRISEISKIVVLTGLHLDEYQNRFLLDLGVHSIKQKPVSVQDLLNELTQGISVTLV